MSVVRIGTNFNIDIEFISPAFYRRLLAWVLDLVVQVFYLVIATRFYAWYIRNSGNGILSNYNQQWLILILLLPFLVYHLVMELTMNGQSIGKKIMGISVISETGGR